MQRNFIIIGSVILVIIAAGAVYMMNKVQTPPAQTTQEETQTQATPPSDLGNMKQDSESTGEGMASEEVVITITADGFSPKEVKVKAGAKVTWMNNDTVSHQVNSASHPTHEVYPPLNAIGMLKAGEKDSMVFPDTGTYKYHDHLNAKLNGSLVVE